MFKRSVLLALAVAAGCAGSQAGAPKANAPTPVAKSGQNRRPEYKPSLYPLRHAPREANEGEGGYQSHVQDH